LMTDEEEEAVNILRMLNNGGNRAFEVINGELKDPFASALLLKKALNSTRSQAKERLLRSLTASCAEKVTGLIFDRPKSKAYFVVDYEMPRKIASISFLGSWDFAKAFLNKNGWRMGKEKSIAYLVRGGVDKKEAERYYREFILIPADRLDNWITHPLRFYSGPSKGEEKDGQVFFTNGLVYNPAKKTAYCYFAGENSYKLPASIFLAEKGRLEEVRFPKGQSDISALILKGKDGYRAYLFQQEFGGSLMARLYLLNGLGLKHFKPLFSGARDDNYLRIFEIDWGN